MDSSDKYKVSEQDAAVWTLIYKLVKAAQHGDPFEASRRVAELISPILDKAERWRKVKEIAKMFDIEGCEGCPMINTNYHICGNAWCVVNALEGEVKE